MNVTLTEKSMLHALFKRKQKGRLQRLGYMEEQIIKNTIITENLASEGLATWHATQ